MRLSPRFYWLPLFFFICCLFLVLSSCDSYNFSQAQPVDRENIYEFPKEFQGNWVPADDSMEAASGSAASSGGFQSYGFGGKDFQPTFSRNKSGSYAEDKFTENNDTILYFVAEKYALFIVHTREIVLMGAWPSLNNKGEFVYPPDAYNSLRTIEYDSLKRPTDTMDNYVLRGNSIYEVDGEGFLGKGYPYLSFQDKVIIVKNDTLCVDLGQNAFLRMLDSNFYVFNIHKMILGEESDWWRIMILQINHDQIFKILECTSKSGKLPSMFYSKDSRSNIFYFDSKWTCAEMLRLIDEGYFTLSTTLIKPGKKWTQ